MLFGSHDQTTWQNMEIEEKEGGGGRGHLHVKVT